MKRRANSIAWAYERLGAGCAYVGNALLDAAAWCLKQAREWRRRAGK